MPSHTFIFYSVMECNALVKLPDFTEDYEYIDQFNESFHVIRPNLLNIRAQTDPDLPSNI